MLNTPLLSSLIAELLSTGIGGNQGLQKFAGSHWELRIAGLQYRFVINHDGSFTATTPANHSNACEASITLNTSDLFFLVQNPQHRGLQLNGRADFLEALGNALQNVNRDTLLTRFIQQRRGTHSYDVTPQRVLERLALHGIKAALSFTAKLWAMLARQLIEYVRDEGKVWVHQTRANVHKDALITLSDRIERIAAKTTHWQ